MHMVSRKKITKLIDVSGLEVRIAKHQNTNLLEKLVLDLLQLDSNHLRASLNKAKYVKKGQLLFTPKRKDGSPVSNAICKSD